jgi:hypothetical protein
MSAARSGSLSVAFQFVRDVIGAFTWKTLLLVQCLAFVLDTLANVVMSFDDSALVLRIVIDETMAFSIVFATLIGDQAVARGARALPAYGLPLAAMSVLAAYTQSWILIWLNREPPEWDWMSVIDIAWECLTKGAMFVLAYVEHHRRLDLARRVRVAELVRARNEQQAVQSRLAEVRADVDPVELMAELGALQKLYERDAPDADRSLDELIDSLREKLAPREGRSAAIQVVRA